MVHRLHSQRGEKIAERVLSYYKSHRKARLFTQEKELKRVHRKCSGNKETQSFHVPREISSSNNILKPQFLGKRRKWLVSAKKNNSSAYLRLLDFCILKYMTVVCDSQVLSWVWKLTSINFSLSHFLLPKCGWAIYYPDSADVLCSIRIWLFTGRILKLSDSSAGLSLLQIGPSSGFLGGKRKRREWIICLDF